MNKNLFTSEAVTEGHPDKVCDRISDAILDAVLEQDPDGRVACECCATTGLVMVMGEMSTKAKIDPAKIARETLKEIGYDRDEVCMNGDSCAVIVAMDEQSADIAMGTNDEIGGAGDQGMMFGYACDEGEGLMPLPITLANQMAYLLSQRRKDGTLPYIYPDGKTQVTVEYGEHGEPTRIDTIVISTQHSDRVKPEDLVGPLKERVINPVLDRLRVGYPTMEMDDYKLFVNPTGRFVKGGPAADTGLTGRKIIVDTYGGYAAHGGGAFSGKDPTKVDRSAAYMARYIAKNVVAAGFARKCQVQLAYAIGVAEPVSVRVDTFWTAYRCTDDKIAAVIRKCFDLTPGGIIKKLDLRRPIYKATSAYGHFGNVTGDERTWEQLDMVDTLRKTMGEMFCNPEW